MTIRVAIVDDQTLVRAGFRILVESADDMTVIGEATTGAEAIRLVEHLHPDVVLMDIRMPELDGIEATRRILSTDTEHRTRVLILTTFETDENVFAAMRAGASGFLLKDAEPDELLEAIRVVAEGDALLAPSVTRRLIQAFVSAPSKPAAAKVSAELELLTEREREVLVLIANGMNNTEIAEALFVSIATAKTHVSRIMTKLDARDRAQLVVFAYESGLVRPHAG
jgi:DNA-binding NarL/FixJ family response regulator